MIIATRPALVLGTVQLGLPYGAANVTGLPSEAEAIAIIRSAIESGFSAIDTARAYGDAERRIGLAAGDRSDVTIITKLDPLAELAADALPRDAVRRAAESIETSRQALRRDRLDALLLHRAAHRTSWNGAVWSYLCAAQADGHIGRLGVSVQSPGELLAALDDPAVGHVQLPFNLLDYRWREAGCIERLAARADVTVHVRSVFLQGLLAAPERAAWPPLAGFDAAEMTRRLTAARQAAGLPAGSDLALAYVLSEDWIDGVVLGMETKDQLASNLAAVARFSLAPASPTILNRLPRAPEELLDPARWPRRLAG